MPDFVKSLPAMKRITNPPLSMDNPEYHMMSQDQLNGGCSTLYNPSSPSYLSPTTSLSMGLPVGGGATLGIPVNNLGIGTIAAAAAAASASAASSASSPQPQTTIQFPVGTFGPRNQYLTQRSSEEEGSDHDYYNDLQRELQPLQPLKRNETTV